MTGLSLVVLLAATPAVKLASPGISSINVTAQLQAFVTDHLNQELVVAGVNVLSSSQVAAVIGLERQKQLLGCTVESDCVAEFANALGVDGLLLGNIGKFGATFQLDVRVAAATDAHNLATVSIRVPDDNALLDAISQAAASIAKQLAVALKVTLIPVAQPPSLVTKSQYTFFRSAGMWTFLVSSAAFVGGLVAMIPTAPPDVMPAPPPSAAFQAALGTCLIGIGGMLVGGLIWLFGGNEQVPVSASLVPSSHGFTFALGGRF